MKLGTKPITINELPASNPR